MLRDRGIAIMFISHKIDEIFEIADDVAIMRNGKNVYLGTTADITPQKFMFYMTGREITDKHFVPKNISRDPILEIKNLSQEGKYKDVSFKLRKGEILGITGLLGSGRTELALSLFGINKPTSGDVFLNGNKVKISSPIMAQKLHIGYVPEDRLTEGLCLRQPIANNITLASLKRLSNRFGLIKQEDILKEANKWVKKFSIATDNALKAASTLSGGNQQKIVLSKWLSNDLDILILNGPTVGVDVGAKQDIHNLLHELANQGLAVIIISDDLAEVIVNCNRVIVMKEGRIVGQMKDEEITDQAVRAIIQ
jgi:simple sugar transport system ATP-binding protein